MFKTTAVVVILAASAGLGDDRKDAVAFTEQQASEHAEVFCSRAALINVPMEQAATMPLCGFSAGNALLEFADVADLFARMNTEALRDAWVFFERAHGETVVFKLRRNEAGFIEAPPVAFVIDDEFAPLDKGADALRKWLAGQEIVAESAESTEAGAIILWGPAER